MINKRKLNYKQFDIDHLKLRIKHYHAGIEPDRQKKRKYELIKPDQQIYKCKDFVDW